MMQRNNRGLDFYSGLAGARATTAATHKPAAIAASRLGLALLATTVLGGTAFAQAKPAQPVTLGEVVVSATRVESSAQKTPVAINVYSGDQLQTSHITTVSGLQTIDPSINIVQGTNSTYVAVRGVTSTDTTEIGDPAVPVARDGFFMNREYGINVAFYDLARVEVLKGPQGTLFGRNSTGGLINIISQAPTKSFGGYIQGSLGDYSANSADGAINLPVNDKVQVRLSGFTDYHSGYRLLLPVNVRGDDERASSGRIQVAVQPIENLKGLISYQYDSINDVGGVAKAEAIGVTHPSGSPFVYTDAYVASQNKLTGQRVRWQLEYSGLPMGLTAIYAGGYDRTAWDHVADSTDRSTSPPTLRVFNQSERPRTWNHELRIATRQDQRLTAQAGVFYFKEVSDLVSGAKLTAPAFASRYVILFPYHIVTESKAVFGQVSYAVVDNVRVSAGARYTEDTKVRTGSSQLSCDLAGIPSFAWAGAGCVGTPPTKFTDGHGNSRDSRPTFHVGVDWDLSPTNLLYAKFDTGYKSGGFNNNGSGPSIAYGPEDVRTWEIGSKNQFLDRKLQFNIDAFYNDYLGFQAQQSTALLSSGQGIFNIGSAKIYGAEAQLRAIIDGIGQFDANATWLHTQLANGIVITSGTIPPVQYNVSGNRLPDAPEFAISGGFERSFDLGAGTLKGRVDGKYSSSFYYDIFNRSGMSSPSYAIGNASLSYSPHTGNWDAEVFVKNFTNNAVVSNAALNLVTTTSTYTYQPPRTYGVRLKYKFG